ncbi:hypothetical protein KCU95_g3970, partial [Aureobasidium melanogenum]
MLFSRIQALAVLALPLAYGLEVLPSATSNGVVKTEEQKAQVTTFNPFQTRAVEDDYNEEDSFPGIPIAITDTTNTLQLLTADNGNLVLKEISDAGPDQGWLATNNSVFGDSNQRFLHYFPESMSTYGVSRLRVAAWGSIPIGANIISFSQVAAGNTSVILSIDTEQNYFWPIACTYNGGGNKVFLVNQTQNMDFVMDPSLQSTITGGVISECDHLALVSTGLISALSG